MQETRTRNIRTRTTRTNSPTNTIRISTTITIFRAGILRKPLSKNPKRRKRIRIRIMRRRTSRSTTSPRRTSTKSIPAPLGRKQARRTRITGPTFSCCTTTVPIITVPRRDIPPLPSPCSRIRARCSPFGSKLTECLMRTAKRWTETAAPISESRTPWAETRRIRS